MLCDRLRWLFSLKYHSLEIHAACYRCLFSLVAELHLQGTDVPHAMGLRTGPELPLVLQVPSLLGELRSCKAGPKKKSLMLEDIWVGIPVFGYYE